MKPGTFYLTLRQMRILIAAVKCYKAIDDAAPPDHRLYIDDRVDLNDALAALEDADSSIGCKATLKPAK